MISFGKCNGSEYLLIPYITVSSVYTVYKFQDALSADLRVINFSLGCVIIVTICLASSKINNCEKSTKIRICVKITLYTTVSSVYIVF